jgi:DNA-binding CsgD family transcriptional regulator
MGLASEYMAAGFPEGVFQEWLTTWRDVDPAFGLMDRHNLTVSSRQHRSRIAGEHWTAKYKRSAIYNEFYRRHALFDSTCLYFRRGDLGAHLHIEADGRASEAADERARSLLEVVEPVLVSAVQSVARPNEAPWDAAGLFSALDEPIAIVDRHGNWVYRATAFDTALDTLPPERRELLFAEMRTRARQLLETVFPAAATASLNERVKPAWSFDIVRLSATTIELPGARVPACLIKLSFRSGTGIANARAAGLSKRECEVAMLLVDGHGNKAIAQRLGISRHTAKRHTESILRKLGVSTRGSVAAALR